MLHVQGNMTMNTLNLSQASNFLHVSERVLADMARSGKVPVAKVGAAWVFLESDLISWLRGKYAWHSSGAENGGTTTYKSQDNHANRDHSRRGTRSKPEHYTIVSYLKSAEELESELI